MNYLKENPPYCVTIAARKFRKRAAKEAEAQTQDERHLFLRLRVFLSAHFLLTPFHYHFGAFLES